MDFGLRGEDGGRAEEGLEAGDLIPRGGVAMDDRLEWLPLALLIGRDGRLSNDGSLSRWRILLRESKLTWQQRGACR